MKTEKNNRMAPIKTVTSAGPSGRSPAEIVGSNPARGMNVC